MSTALEILFKVVGYGLMFYGIWLTAGVYLVQNHVKVWVVKYKRYSQMRRLHALNTKEDVVKSKSKLYSYLELLLQSTSRKNQVSVSNFMALTVILFLATTVSSIFLLEAFLFPLVIGVFVGLIPYFLLLYRLESARLRASSSFMDEFHIILQAYQGTTKNIYYVLLQTVDSLEDALLKKIFRKLVVAFQKDKSEEEFKQSINVLIFSINSTFAQRFGNLLIRAYLDDINISTSLVDLNSDIIERKKQLDSEKTEKMQSIILGFTPIAILPLTTYFAYKLSGPVDFWYFFFQKESLTLYILSIILSVTSVMVALLYRKPKTKL